jgi:hypothetical protein
MLTTTEFNNVVLAVIAFFNVITAILYFITSKQVNEVKQVVTEVKENVVTIEKATNSMKDALVKTTELEALARGTAEGRAAVHAETDEARIKKSK